MIAYQLDFCGQGNRIIIHPKGLPPGWRESNLDPETQRKAHRKAEEIVAAKIPIKGEAVLRILRRQSPEASPAHIGFVQFHHVIHLNPETLELIEVFPVQ